MALITQTIANLLDGVSQKPAKSRPSSQSEIQENVLSHRTFGLRRRPPTNHVARLTSTTTGYGAAFTHEVRQSSTDRYVIAVVAGDLKVFDLATGAEQTVVFPHAKAYLTSTKGFKAFTVGDTTYLLNLDTVVKRGTTKAPVQAKEALIFVRQADFSTRYSISLGGVSVTLTTADGSTPQSRPDIATDTLANSLVHLLVSDKQLSAEFVFTLYGSTIHVRRLNNLDFDISSSDGLADKGLKVVKDSVQTFADLPARARDGMIVQIAGDPESNADNYWVSYSDDALPGQMGVWIECPAPGTPLGLDATTMPWSLTRKGLVVDGLVADAAPQPPSIIPQAAVVPGGFTSDPDSGDTFTGDQDVTLTRDDQRADATLAGMTSTQRLLRTYFDVDTTLLDYGQNITVTLLVNTGSGFVERDSKLYVGGLKLQSEILSYDAVIPSGTVMRVQLHYGSDGTPATRFREAIVTLHRSSSTHGGGTAAIATTSILVSFNPAAIYPVGTTIALLINNTATITDAPPTDPYGGAGGVSPRPGYSGYERIVTTVTTYTYAITGSDKTGAQVATALAALTGGSSVGTNPSPGLVQFSGVTVTFRVSVTITQPTLTLYVSGATFTPSEHVGRLLVNETDGSQGTVTANGATSITVSALAGGIANAFRPGDVCHITGSVVNFVFSTVDWTNRVAGDLTTCPLPSFVDKALDEIFFYQNRLGVTAEGGTVVCSESGRSQNFMRVTATQLLASDVIDVRSAHPSASTFDNAVEWNDVLVLFSKSGHQFALKGDPILTPQTVQLTHMSSFPMSGTARPITVGKYLYFCLAQGLSTKFTQAMQMFATANDKADATDLTGDVPQYLTGSPQRIVGDAKQEVLVILTDTATDTLWVYSYHYEDATSPYANPQKVMSSWSKWTFSGAQIISLSMLDGVLSLIAIRSDGVYLETLNLASLPAATADHRDRQGNASPVAQTFRWKLSTLYRRNLQTGAPARAGRLQVRYATFDYFDATDFTVTVTAIGRSPRTYVYHSATAATGTFRFPVLTQSEAATIEVTNATTGGCAFSTVSWEGTFTARAVQG